MCTAKSDIPAVLRQWRPTSSRVGGCQTQTKPLGRSGQFARRLGYGLKSRPPFASLNRPFTGSEMEMFFCSPRASACPHDRSPISMNYSQLIQLYFERATAMQNYWTLYVVI